MSFDKKAKLLTGLKFLNMISRPGFLSNGHTTASFKDSGKCPASNDLLMIIVMMGRRASHLLTEREGIGSSGQVGTFTKKALLNEDDTTLVHDQRNNSRLEVWTLRSGRTGG